MSSPRSKVVLPAFSYSRFIRRHIDSVIMLIGHSCTRVIGDDSGYSFVEVVDLNDDLDTEVPADHVGAQRCPSGGCSTGLPASADQFPGYQSRDGLKEWAAMSSK